MLRTVLLCVLCSPAVFAQRPAGDLSDKAPSFPEHELSISTGIPDPAQKDGVLVLNYYGLGATCLSLGREDCALDNFNKALDLLHAGPSVSSGCLAFPLYAHIYESIAGIHLKNGRPEEALPFLQEGLRECSLSDRKTAGIFRMLAIYHNMRLEYGPAKDYARKGLALTRLSGRARGGLNSALGSALAGLGDAAGAMAAYNDALTLLPEGDEQRLSAHYGLVEQYIARKEYGPAAGSARKGLAIFGQGYGRERGQLSLKLGEALAGLGDTTGAREAYKRALGLLPEGDGQRSLAYQMYLRMLLNPELKPGLAAAAIPPLLKEAEGLSRSDDKLLLCQEVWDLLDRAYDLFDKGSESEMAGTLRESGILSGNPVFNDFFWGHFYLRHNKPAEARARFLKILKSAPGSPVGYAGLENAGLQTGDLMEVMKSFTQAERLVNYEYYLPIHAPLMAIYKQIEDKVPPQLLGRMAAEYGELVPEYKSVLCSLLGLLYIKHGMYPEAKISLLSAFDLPSSSSIAHPEWPYAGLGLLAFKTGDYEAAEKYFKKTMEMRPESPQGACPLVHVYLATRRREAAAEVVRKFTKAAQVQDTNITRLNHRSMVELLNAAVSEHKGETAPDAAPPDIWRCFRQ